MNFLTRAWRKLRGGTGSHTPPVRAAAAPYEGATSGRRLATWGTQSSGPNAAIFSSLQTLRSRARELVRNVPIIDGAVDSFVSNLIGSGINPRWQIKDQGLRDEIQQLWADWTMEADADGTASFYGLQATVARALVEGGEALIRLRFRRGEDGLTVPLQLQGLEGDHLDEAYNAPAANGNIIRMGIEFDQIGRRAAYHLWRDHPADFFAFSQNAGIRSRVDAAEILHVYRPLRLGQVRGRPWLASTIVKLRELDQYEDAELVRKKTAAMFGGFITEAAEDAYPGSALGKNAGTDSSDRQIIALEPGTFPILPPGYKVEFAKPEDVGGNLLTWLKSQLRQIARGIGITYEQLTGDLEGVNYSSIRAGLLEFRRLCKAIQLHTIIHQFCRPIGVAWMDQAVLSGALRIPDYAANRREYTRITWRPDGWDWVDPLKDQAAEKMAVRSGFKSRAQVVAERGQDIEVVDREIVSDNERADGLGLVLDTDPRKTADSGVEQQLMADETAAPPKKGDGQGADAQNITIN